MTRTRAMLCLLTITVGLGAAPRLSLAQDADADGVPDAADIFPCDATRASVTYFPGASSSALLAFEDQWPGHTDLDFNDVALRVHFRLESNAAGAVARLAAVFDPVALGGDLSNGLGLVLPALNPGGVVVRRRLGSGAWSNLGLESDASITVLLSSNLRELYGNAQGRINSVFGSPRLGGQRLEVEFTFNSPVSISAAAAPFDVFIFRTGDTGHQIHLPQYSGTAAMSASLFNSGQDRSTSTRRFVHLSGIPAALNLMTTTLYPREGSAISALFPDIIGFGSSGGQQNATFYATNVLPSNGHDVAADALPAVAAPQCPERGHLVPNSRFATDLAGWRLDIGGSATWDGTSGRTQPGAVALSSPTSGYRRVQYRSECFPVLPSTDYAMGASFRKVSGGFVNCFPMLMTFGDATCFTQIATAAAAPGVGPGTGDWTTFVVPWTRTPAGASSGQLALACEDQWGSVDFTVLADDAIARRMFPTNGNFASSVDGWSLETGTALAWEDRPSNASGWARLTSSSSGFRAARALSDCFPVEGATDYSIAASFQKVSGSFVACNLELLQYSGGTCGTFISTYSPGAGPIIASSGSSWPNWTDFAFSPLTTNASAGSARMRINCTDTVGTNDFVARASNVRIDPL
jgi:LruC domain-containing protein